MTGILVALLVGLAVLTWPRVGLVARIRRARGLARRARREDALKHVLKSEASALPATLESLAGALQITTGSAAHLVDQLEAEGLVELEGGTARLLSPGRDIALRVVRAHRLWESYLAEQTGVAEPEWHSRAEKQEHLLTARSVEALAARLGHPLRDPHGDAIPGDDGSLEGERTRSLNSVAPGTAVVITHIEDEPVAVYRQLAAQGLRPGMKAFVIDKGPARIRFWAEGTEHVLAPVSADNISIAPIPDVSPAHLVAHKFLATLQPGAVARVVEISPACRGPERRRLLDLGFVPGTTVEVDMVSPAGDPTAYRLRGSVIALRREQARLIRIEAAGEAARA